MIEILLFLFLIPFSLRIGIAPAVDCVASIVEKLLNTHKTVKLFLFGLNSKQMETFAGRLLANITHANVTKFMYEIQHTTEIEPLIFVYDHELWYFGSEIARI